MCKSDKTGKRQATAKSDGVIGMTIRINNHLDGLDKLLPHHSYLTFRPSRPPACSPALPRLRTQLQLQLQAQLSAHPLATRLLLWSGQVCRLTRPPAFSPARRSPSIKSPERGSLLRGPASTLPTRHLQAGPNFQQASAGPRTWGASAPSLLAPFPSHLHLVPLQSSAPSVTRQDPRLARAPATISYLLPVRVWSGRATPMPPSSPL